MATGKIGKKGSIFAKIICGEIACDKVYDDEHVLAFRDVNPAAPVHVLVVPKGSYSSYNDFVQRAPAQAIATFFRAVQHLTALTPALPHANFGNAFKKN